ncbi:MAG: pyruvate dehydrogenase E2 component (dihydrolipoamide acetyltransferase) [Planctomycetota bacterium]|jgi:pyruvate dehydrogenase E2 component (dihydrolipoamide acetyltransferase)
MVLEFKLPDIGEGVAEGEIVQWLVKTGDDIAEFQNIVEVMTDKATVEIPSPAPGKMGEILAQAGDVVPVGTVIFTIVTDGASAAAPAKKEKVAAVAAPAAATAAPVAIATAPVISSNSKVLAVPSARRVARELGVDLGLVTGTGRNGVVRRTDVEAFQGSGGLASSAPAAAMAVNAGGETRKPFRGVRRKIAEAMTRSAFTAVHFTIVEEVDVTDLVELRATAKHIGAQQEIKVTYMPFIMKAVANGLMKFPMLNGHLDEGANEIVNCNYVNLGIATDTPNGLIVPVIKDVQNKGILQLAEELGELAARTRDGKVKPEELSGSTFTITNAGNIGGTLATPIINFPDIAIMGVHRLMKKPGVISTPDGDEIAIRQFMNFSCSVDHRLADGADGARFLAWIRVLLETPGLLAL